MLITKEEFCNQLSEVVRQGDESDIPGHPEDIGYAVENIVKTMALVLVVQHQTENYERALEAENKKKAMMESRQK